MNRIATSRLFSLALLCATVNAAPTPPDKAAIAEVAAGKRTEARAAWWGFDPVDSTTALQAAIKSGARKLIVEDMGSPWIVDNLRLAGNQEIVFEKGVVVQAKRGEFKEPTASLFSAELKSDITLTGHGATLKMWKQDYDDPKQYKHAEWRNVLSFRSCSQVRVTGLTLADSGGDGIYLGVAKTGVPCSDVVIKGVTCVNNYRQGISVISARDLLIEDCVLKDTGGTAPMAGIDFEPNDASEELVNCVMRNCVSENNQGGAFLFYLRPLNAASTPISIRIENCRARGGNSSVRFVTGNDTETAGVKGTADFIHCDFEAGELGGIVIGNNPANGTRVNFVGCRITDAAANEPATAPIAFTSQAMGTGDFGNVRFDHCTVIDRLERLPMSYQDLSGGVGLSGITGTLIVKCGEQQTTHRLTPELIAEWMPFHSFRKIARMDVKAANLTPAMPGAKPDAKQRNPARQRGLSEWLLWAGADEKAAFTVSVGVVGKAEPQPAVVSLLSSSGKLTKLKQAAGGQESAYEFTASEGGAHKIICEAGQSTTTVNSATHRVCLYSQSAAFHLLGTTGRYYFWVPSGTKEFAVKISGGGGSEGVKAALLDPAGNVFEEKDNITQAHQFIAKPKNATEGEVWSLHLDKPSTGVLEDFHVQLQGTPPLLSHAKESLLKPTR